MHIIIVVVVVTRASAENTIFIGRRQNLCRVQQKVRSTTLWRWYYDILYVSVSIKLWLMTSPILLRSAHTSLYNYRDFIRYLRKTIEITCVGRHDETTSTTYETVDAYNTYIDFS